MKLNAVISKIKPLDLILFLLALAAIGFSAFTAYAGPQNTARVYIQGSGKEWIFPLDAEETAVIPGPLGNSVIRISNREAWFESSPCTNQVCVMASHVTRQGVWAACLPNNVLLIIEGTGEQGENQIDVDSTTF